MLQDRAENFPRIPASATTRRLLLNPLAQAIQKPIRRPQLLLLALRQLARDRIGSPFYISFRGHQNARRLTELELAALVVGEVALQRASHLNDAVAQRARGPIRVEIPIHRFDDGRSKFDETFPMLRQIGNDAAQPFVGIESALYEASEGVGKCFQFNISRIKSRCDGGERRLARIAAPSVRPFRFVKQLLDANTNRAGKHLDYSVQHFDVVYAFSQFFVRFAQLVEERVERSSYFAEIVMALIGGWKGARYFEILDLFANQIVVADGSIQADGGGVETTSDDERSGGGAQKRDENVKKAAHVTRSNLERRLTRLGSSVS